MQSKSIFHIFRGLGMPTAVNQGVLHIAKYPSQDVCGVFLKRKDAEAITACIPLFHTNCVSVSIMRTAMSFIEELSDFEIVGIYFATNRAGVPSVINLLHRQMESAIGKRIYLYQYDSEMLKHCDPTTAPFRIVKVSKDDAPSRAEEPNSLLFDAVQFVQDIESKLHLTNIFDLEDHLDNPQREWIRI
jgi:hypothetical protein